MSAAMIQNWFGGLEPVIKNIKHYNIYNFDESGFMLGQQASRTSSIGRQRARAEVNRSKRGSQTIIERIRTREVVYGIKCCYSQRRPISSVVQPLFEISIR